MCSVLVTGVSLFVPSIGIVSTQDANDASLNHFYAGTSIPLKDRQFEQLDLTAKYGIDAAFSKRLDKLTTYAIAAGLEAMIDADWISHTCTILPEAVRDRVGVIFASSFANRFYPQQHGAKTNLLRHALQANTQLAEIVHARGVNLALSASCCSTANAVATARDFLMSGRCDVVVVMACDLVTDPEVSEAFVNGFQQLNVTSEASRGIPFDETRNGPTFGSAAIGIVLESDHVRQSTSTSLRIALTQVDCFNNAFHATHLSKENMACHLIRLVQHPQLGVDDASNLLYFSHDPGTRHQGGCALAESFALKAAFPKNNDVRKVMVSNTKFHVGHTMGASVELILAVMALRNKRVPILPAWIVPDAIDAGQVSCSQSITGSCVFSRIWVSLCVHTLDSNVTKKLLNKDYHANFDIFGFR